MVYHCEASSGHTTPLQTLKPSSLSESSESRGATVMAQYALEGVFKGSMHVKCCSVGFNFACLSAIVGRGGGVERVRVWSCHALVF